ncbi:MAG: phytoene synthase, partial [Litorivivens sp.]
MKELFDTSSEGCATLITKKYSTSFSIAVKLLAPSVRQAIYNIYGFVRVADEIVDSFHDFEQKVLLDRFEDEYAFALKHGISSNPIINAFERTKSQYNIDDELVQAFLNSMRADLTKQNYASQEEVDAYIYGSADVVGLMCLKVFVNGDQSEFDRLKDPAMKLGTAFQKVNFLRDFKHDFDQLKRSYFPNVDSNSLSTEQKDFIVREISQDFYDAYQGIKQLPKEAKFGVYVAYKYYMQLLKKVDRASAADLQEKRIRVSNWTKTYLLLNCYMR